MSNLRIFAAVMSLLNDLNTRYIELHQAKEEAFWSHMMGLADSVPGDFEAKEIALKEFSADPGTLRRVRSELERNGCDDEERTGLRGWERYFAVNTIESEEGRALYGELVAMEGELGRAHRSMNLGYRSPTTGEHIPASSVGLSLIIQTSSDEAVRKSAWEGLRSIEPFVLEHGLIDIIRHRNRLARALGYQDYYEYKVTITEGFDKKTLFDLLDGLEEGTRQVCRGAMERLAAEHGAQAIEPWNFEYITGGDVTTKADPYFRFDAALGVWGRSFAALGIDYNDATLQLDLVERQGKHDNGFMHGTMPTFVENGVRHPARINFTANAVPGQVGSGRNALNTLLHEGGHAAHFSNIAMPAPCFSQEFAPTSVALGETQSMFLDSLMGDADWMTRYALDVDGNPIPRDLVHALLEKAHRYRAHILRRMLAVSYAEKALYEMPEGDLTSDTILETLRAIERRLLFQPSAGRPILAIPHLLASEASAYYHGYTLAQMAVYQTRDYFLQRDGHLMDNPRIGPDLTRSYWRPGNSRAFLNLVADLTGKPFSARATVELVEQPVEDVLAGADRQIDRIDSVPPFDGPVSLGAVIRVVHGDLVVTSTETEGGFDDMAESFGEWIRSLSHE